MGALIENLYELFELTRENELISIVDEVELNSKGTEKLCFEVASQFNRPHEFFQALLDVIRIIFEPNIMSTTILNSNPCLLFEEIPVTPFRLGYLSSVSEEDEALSDFYARVIKTQMSETGFDAESAGALFIMITVGCKYYKIKFMRESVKFFDAGMSIDTLMGNISAIIQDRKFEKSGGAVIGFSEDAALRGKIRISMWMFIPKMNLQS